MVTSTYAKQSTVQGLIQVRGHRGAVQYRQWVSRGTSEGPSETEPAPPATRLSRMPLSPCFPFDMISSGSYAINRSSVAPFHRPARA